jgi:hypothetical protein
MISRINNTNVQIMDERRARERRRRRRESPTGRPTTWMLSLVSLMLFPPACHYQHQMKCSAFILPHLQQPARYYLRNNNNNNNNNNRNDIEDRSSSSSSWHGDFNLVLQMAASSMGAQQPKNNAKQPGRGLSPYFQAILGRTNDRQRFVTGKYPVTVTVEENPTQKWLNLGRSSEGVATSVVLVNNTQIEKSLASYSRFQWIDDSERQECYVVSMELLAEIHIHKPGYLHIMSGDGAGSSAAALREASSCMTMKWDTVVAATAAAAAHRKKMSRSTAALYEQQQPPPQNTLEENNNNLQQQWKGGGGPVLYRDRLWVSGFTLAGRKGFLKSMDVESGHIHSVNARSESMALWPNEMNSVPSNLIQTNHHHNLRTSIKKQPMDDALLVSDGFLVPGKDRGGIYIVQKPGNSNSEWTISLTDRSDKHRWFYHR